MRPDAAQKFPGASRAGNEGGQGLLRNEFRALSARMAVLLADDRGMSTVEYAIGTIAAAAFGAILYTVVTGDSIVSALTNIIARALNTKA
jgi:hypothetical protein